MGQYYKPIILNENNEIQHFFISWTFDEGQKLIEHSFMNSSLVAAVEQHLLQNTEKKLRLVWAGDYADDEAGTDKTLFSLAKDMEEPAHDQTKIDDSKDLFIINHTKKVYFQKPYIVECNIIHPLPLLTSEGNGRGLGDYEGTNMELVGTWARDVIQCSYEEPVKLGYEKIDMPVFVEQ